MSRRERKKQDVQSNRSVSENGISNVYYIVIGILFLILIGLIIFIFSRGGDDVNLNDNNTENPVEDVQPDEPAETEDPDTNETDPVDEEPADTEDPATDPDAEPNEETQEEEPDADENANTEDLDEGETETVNSDAPHDASHSVDYNSGSADRVAIKNQIMQATGLGSDLTEWWIGNDGPGRVKATVSDSANTTYYDVFLQYGDGNWHVTSFQRVSGN